MSFLDPIALLGAVKTTIEGLTLFDEVALYDAPDLEQALLDLTVRKGAVCLIVPMGDRYDQTADGATTSFRASYSFATLIAARDPRDPQAAVFSDDATPGVIALKHDVVSGLAGQTLGIARVLIAPIEGDTILVEDKRNNRSRKAWMHLFETPAGVLSATTMRRRNR